MQDFKELYLKMKQDALTLAKNNESCVIRCVDAEMHGVSLHKRMIARIGALPLGFSTLLFYVLLTV